MASGCPAVRAVRTVRRSGDAFGIGRDQVGTAPPLSRATTTEYGLVPALSALRAPHGIVGQEEAQHPER